MPREWTPEEARINAYKAHEARRRNKEARQQEERELAERLNREEGPEPLDSASGAARRRSVLTSILEDPKALDSSRIQAAKELRAHEEETEKVAGGDEVQTWVARAQALNALPPQDRLALLREVLGLDTTASPPHSSDPAASPSLTGGYADVVTYARPHPSR